MSTLYTMVAPCFFGTESTLNFEVKRLGAQNIQVTDGRVAFQGGADVIAAANLNLRTAERVLLLLATYKATTFDELFDGCYNIAWEDLLPANAAFPVKGSSLSSQLSSVPACQSIVKKAIVKRLMHGHKVGTLPEDGALYKVRFALRKDTVEIYLDTSGDGLHKRGYRKNATLAPIKETLAAAIADLGRVRRDSLVQDPFCGSGTLVIEAAQKALNLAPGLRRRFAAEHFDFVPADIWAEQRQKALAEVRKDAAFEGIGYDIDPAAVALANANAKLAGVGHVGRGGDLTRAVQWTRPELRSAGFQLVVMRRAGDDVAAVDDARVDETLRDGLRHVAIADESYGDVLRHDAPCCVVHTKQMQFVMPRRARPRSVRPHARTAIPGRRG